MRCTDTHELELLLRCLEKKDDAAIAEINKAAEDMNKELKAQDYKQMPKSMMRHANYLGYSSAYEEVADKVMQMIDEIKRK